MTNKNKIFIVHARINFHVEHIHVSFLITRYRYEECFSESYLLFGGIKKRKKKKNSGSFTPSHVTKQIRSPTVFRRALFVDKILIELYISGG